MKTSMIRSSSYYYSDVYIHVKGTITLEKQLFQKTEKIIFKICASFKNWIDEINNKKVDDAHYVDVVMSMYN